MKEVDEKQFRARAFCLDTEGVFSFCLHMLIFGDPRFSSLLFVSFLWSFGGDGEDSPHEAVAKNLAERPASEVAVTSQLGQEEDGGSQDVRGVHQQDGIEADCYGHDDMVEEGEKEADGEEQGAGGDEGLAEALEQSSHPKAGGDQAEGQQQVDGRV